MREGACLRAMNARRPQLACMVKSKPKLEIMLTQEQSRDIRDYILNRELAIISHGIFFEEQNFITH